MGNHSFAGSLQPPSANTQPQSWRSHLFPRTAARALPTLCSPQLVLSYHLFLLLSSLCKSSHKQEPAKPIAALQVSFDLGSAVPVFNVEASIRLIVLLQKHSPSALRQLS